MDLPRPDASFVRFDASRSAICSRAPWSARRSDNPTGQRDCASKRDRTTRLRIEPQHTLSARGLLARDDYDSQQEQREQRDSDDGWRCAAVSFRFALRLSGIQLAASLSQLVRAGAAAKERSVFG